MRGSLNDSGMRAALSPAAEEEQLISLATTLAMKQLREGTASSQTINHYLEAGSPKARLQQKVLENQAALLEAKIALINDSKKSEEMYSAVLDALKEYNGTQDEE